MSAPVVSINKVSHFKVSNILGFDVSFVTFTFDVPVVAYTVNVLGTAPTTGTVAQSGSKLVADIGAKTIDELIPSRKIEEVGELKMGEFLNARVDVLYSDNITLVSDLMTFPAGKEIYAGVEYAKLYTEGENRVNIYGMSTTGEWTPYNQQGR